MFSPAGCCPHWSLRMPSCGSSPASLATRSRPNKIRFPPGSSTIRTTPAPPNTKAGRFPKSCSAATMRRLRNGGMKQLSKRQGKGVPTCSDDEFSRRAHQARICDLSARKTQPDGALGGRGIDDLVVLRDFEHPLCNEAACGPANILHMLGPVGGKMRTGDFAGANGRGTGNFRKAGKDGIFESGGGRSRLPAPTGFRKVANIVPAVFPFFPPSDAATAGETGFFRNRRKGHEVRKSSETADCRAKSRWLPFCRSCGRVQTCPT